MPQPASVEFKGGEKMKDPMSEFCYSLEEMQHLLKDGLDRPMARSTLLRKLRQKTGVPPSISPRRGVYWFPKDQFADWLRQLPVAYEVKGAS